METDMATLQQGRSEVKIQDEFDPTDAIYEEEGDGKAQEIAGPGSGNAGSSEGAGEVCVATAAGRDDLPDTSGVVGAGPGTSHFHCSSEWHFGNSGRPSIADRLYSWALRLSKSKKLDDFFASVPHLAEYFRCSERAIQRALRQLTKAGFFVFL